jgi:hypothetical protein
MGHDLFSYGNLQEQATWPGTAELLKVSLESPLKGH